MRDDLISPADIEAAARRLAGVAEVTPLLPFPGTGLRIKAESLQVTGSFKVRGAYYAISSLPAADRARGVIAHSSGNHAQAVAYAARLLGVPAVVVVPDNAPEVKVAAARRHGADIVTVRPGLAARLAATEQLIGSHGYTLIPPFDDPRVIAGQGTAGLEIAAAGPDTDLVVVPVSGGGLISGIATAVRARLPRATVIGVEPELAADARDSLRRGEPVAWPAADTQRTVADALRVEQVSELTLAHMRRHVAGIVTVTDEEMLTAVRLLATEAHLVAEPGGAAAVAACLLRGGELPAARAPVAVLSGGNIGPALLARVLAPAGSGEGARVP